MTMRARCGALVTAAAAHRPTWLAASHRRPAPHIAAADALPGTLPPGKQCSVVADDGVRLACEEVVAAHGPAVFTVVFVHGFAVDRRIWYLQRRSLAQLDEPSVRLVCYDQRSHGRSERAPRDTCTIEQLGRDLDAVIRALVPNGPLVLVGHSMGGMAIMALAQHRPELFGDRVGGVALLATSAGEVARSGLPCALLSRHNPLLRGVGLLARVQPALVEVVRRVAGALIRSITRSYAFADRAVDPRLVHLVDTMISANAVDALGDFADTVGSHDRLSALPALAGCEVLVVTGGSDRVIPRSHAEVIVTELPEATLVELPRVGHLPMLERPAVVDEALIGLLRRCARRTEAGRRRRWRA